MNTIPSEFNHTLDEIFKSIASVEGHLTDKEIRLLALLAAFPTTKGEILEIGSFKGKSTIVLAKAALLVNQPRIIAVDPLTSPSITDPSLHGQSSGWNDFQTNLKNGAVFENVEFYQQFSSDLAKNWNPNRKLRLLWIDGDHTYKGAKSDFDLFFPFLAEGAIVAMHDVLHQLEGPLRVFIEDILQSPQFGAVGFCGSIGWAQFSGNQSLSSGNLKCKEAMLHRLMQLRRCVANGQKIQGWAKLRYKLARARIPHDELTPAEFAEKVRFQEKQAGTL